MLWFLPYINMNQPCVHVSPILNPPPSSFLKVHLGEFPGNPMVKTPCFHYQGPCSIPGQRTKIPQAARHSQKAYTMKVTFSINVYNIEPFHYPMCVCVCVCVRARACVSRFSHVRLFATLWTVAHQTPLSMGFSRQGYWSGLPCPPPGDLPNPGIEPVSL